MRRSDCVGLDFPQHLPAVLAGQIEVQQDQVGAGGVGVAVPLAQEVHRLDAVLDHPQPVPHLGLLEGLDRQPHVRLAVLDQQEFDRS